MDELIGASVAMHCVRAAIDRFADSQTPLVLIGETGTGKSRLARLMAALSPRADAPFICIDGAALDQGLMPADILYAWAAAEGGTLFIDHIGETPAVLQAHLASLLGKSSFAGTREWTRHPRLIAANQKRLESGVAMGHLDAMLFACLHGAAIHLPALRYRLEDIPDLADHFFAYVGTKGRRYQLAATAVERLQGYLWPGNVRELNNVLHRGMVLADARTTLQPHDIVFDARGFAAQSGTRLDDTRSEAR